MKEVNLIIHIEVIDGKRDLQIEAFKKLKPLVLAEPGCIQYDLFSDESDDNKFVLIEKWASQTDLDAHDKTEHMINADAKNLTFRAKPAQVIKIRALLPF